MKNLLLTCFLIGALFACSKEELGAWSKEELRLLNGTLGQEIKLKDGQAVRYNISPAEGSQVLQVKLESVRDSRCPSGALCVTYGSAEAVLQISAGDRVIETVTLCLGVCDGGFRSSNTTTVLVNAFAYSIVLLEVTPYPTLEQKPRVVKEAKLIVERM